MNARDTESRVERALRQMGTAVVLVEEPAHVETRRDRHLGVLTSFAVHTFERRKSRRRWLAGAAIAACALAAAVLAVRLNGAPLRSDGTSSLAAVRAIEGTVLVAQRDQPLGAVARLPFPMGMDDRIATADGIASVDLASGATVTLDPRAELAFGATTNAGSARAEHLRLRAGRVRLHVPKLGTGSLDVTTPDACVTVHGTTFLVEVRKADPATGAPAATTVSVIEGRVSVRSAEQEVFIGPGASWSSAPATPPVVETEPSPPASVAPAPPGRPLPSSTLSEETRLFRAAVLARKSGDPRRAADLLSRLLSRYPTSPLAAEARAERERALADEAKSPNR